jgi:hypothetical protein
MPVAMTVDVGEPPMTTEIIMKHPSQRLRYALLAATLIAGAAGMAAAQTAPTYDPAQLPATKGRVAQYSLTPRGDVDGLILDDGTEVHLPPHLGAQLVFAVKPGDQVTIRGLRAREVPMVQAMQVTNDANNQSVTDTGPAGGPRGPRGRGPGPEAARQPLEAQGVVKAQLHGPRGDLNGVLLADGTIIRLPPPEAQRMAAALAVGQTVAVRGDGMSSDLGRVIAARAIGPNPQQMTEVKGPPMRFGGPGPDGERHGPRPGGPRGPGAPPPSAPL